MSPMGTRITRLPHGGPTQATVNLANPQQIPAGLNQQAVRDNLNKSQNVNIVNAYGP